MFRLLSRPLRASPVRRSPFLRTMFNTPAFVRPLRSPTDGLHAHPCIQNKVLYAPLAEVDPEVQNIIDKETWRQFSGLELIASEVCIFSTFPEPTLIMTH